MRTLRLSEKERLALCSALYSADQNQTALVDAHRDRFTGDIMEGYEAETKKWNAELKDWAKIRAKIFNSIK